MFISPCFIYVCMWIRITYMYVYVYIFMCVYVCIYIHTNICVCIRIYTYMCVYTYIYVYVCVCVCICICMYVLQLRMYKHSMYICVYLYVHIRVRAYVLVCWHICYEMGSLQPSQIHTIQTWYTHRHIHIQMHFEQVCKRWPDAYRGTGQSMRAVRRAGARRDTLESCPHFKISQVIGSLDSRERIRTRWPQTGPQVLRLRVLPLLRARFLFKFALCIVRKSLIRKCRMRGGIR